PHARAPVLRSAHRRGAEGGVPRGARVSAAGRNVPGRGARQGHSGGDRADPAGGRAGLPSAGRSRADGVLDHRAAAAAPGDGRAVRHPARGRAAVRTAGRQLSKHPFRRPQRASERQGLVEQLTEAAMEGIFASMAAWITGLIALVVPGFGTAEPASWNGYVEADYVYAAPASAGQIERL